MMASDAPEMHPARRRLADLVTLAARRMARAEEKIRAARFELDAASIAHTGALNRLAAWDVANPDPQFSPIDATKSKGERA